MSPPIILFYHSLFFIGEEFKPGAFAIVREQMFQFEHSGLWNAANEIICGINGGEESEDYARLLIGPKAKLMFHGLDCRNENLTLMAMRDHALSHSGEAYYWYGHCKGATHDPNAGYANLANRWRRCGMRSTVENWNVCLGDLNAGYESVGVHWMQGVADGTQNIWAGNCFWVKASFLRTVPSMMHRERIKTSGIKALESRYEAECFIGFAPRLPRVRDYATHGLTACP